MARYAVPPNTGKVRVVVALGGKFAVWNGKTGKNEFRILVRTKKQAQELMSKINAKDHEGFVEVWN
jgi:hypothetical protein